jgi:hypothetical protein
VFPARYELNSYIVFRKRLVSKRLSKILFIYRLNDRANASQLRLSYVLIIIGARLVTEILRALGTGTMQQQVSHSKHDIISNFKNIFDMQPILRNKTPRCLQYPV